MSFFKNCLILGEKVLFKLTKDGTMFLSQTLGGKMSVTPKYITYLSDKFRVRHTTINKIRNLHFCCFKYII